MLEPSRADEVLDADVGVVLGVPAEPDRLLANESALALQEGLRTAFPDRPALAVVLTGDPRGAAGPGDPLLLPPAGSEAPAIYIGGRSGEDAALPALLELALAHGAPACALLDPMPRPRDPGWLHALLDPVLQGGFDLVAPGYARRRLDGVLVTGIVYPLTRALFGHRLRQPLGTEIVISRRLAEILLHSEEWRTDPVHAGADLWVITRAIVGECRMAQVVLGARPVPSPQPPDVSQALVRVLGTVFHEMERHAPRWMRIRGSRPVPTFGDEHLAEESAPPPVAPLLSAFALGCQDLRPLWAGVLPPQTLLAILRIPRESPDRFRIPDPLWARVIFDFAIGWRVKVMDRDQLLRSLTPLYLGWVASFVAEVGPLDTAAAEARIERLCAAFESEKPYLISRWRWPDRFTP